MSTDAPNTGQLRVAADELTYGLYVAALDRPWSEVPVMFQGFEIRDDEELEVLRQHCQYVYIDRARSRQEALEKLGPDTGEPPSERGKAPTPTVRRDVADVFAEARQPDKDAFRELVSEAHENRTAALEFMDDVMSSLAAGEILDTDSARGAVSDLAGTVSRNTTASLWLTNLRERDEYLTRHAVNVCVLMLAYGVHHGFARPDLERMAMGALLMDVGMAKLPDAILANTGQLSPDEMELMMRHPIEGAEIVKAAGFVPRETLEIIQMHHERLDGSGYPQGLQASQVPLHARLAGMLDTYDAMTSPRAFQDATPADRVLQYLLNESESTFGQTPVQQLIQCIGLYPVGSLIELDNGAVAIVIGSRPDARVRPTVLLVRTPDGHFYDKRVLLNLAADPEASGPSARTVRRVLDPVYEDIDVPGIVALEFGMDE
jgi:HD-GYP domain-containing protein (c-di-GMP phosphodiesterase class II)